MFEEPSEIFRYALGLLVAMLLLLWATLVMARLEHRKLASVFRDIPTSLLKREKIAPLSNKFKVGIILSFVGGGISLFELVQGPSFDFGGFVIAFLIFTGCAIAYKGFLSIGVLTTYLSSLIALIGGGIRLSSMLSIFGSILMLLSVGWKPTKKGGERLS